MSDDRPKSAFELPMERPRQEARQFYKSKVAERDVLHQAAVAHSGASS